ncbi:glycosyltransferase family 2 protein [Desulfocurvibacter africanus]|uniref:glycosyltransferase family 2 protein n=1 Tax=Desulfocurvibacter africanus TaxID=873 RepID=UPI00042580A5|nr:glycosyltransferase family 2 protein [Desulfocurvibacter africanus]
MTQKKIPYEHNAGPIIMEPLLSVVMPVYNSYYYLPEAINSILTQTFHKFEFIIINDASTDDSQKIIDEFASLDTRIKVVINKQNLGVAGSLNKGISLARSSLIVRMDSDDCSMPNRLHELFEFMNANPEVVVCGSFMTIYETGALCTRPVENSYLHARLLFEVCFFHPTVIFRKPIIMEIAGGYSTDLAVEDYDLWVRLADNKDIKFANIPLSLLRYRVHSGQVSFRNYDKVFEQSSIIKKKQLVNLGIHLNDKEFSTFIDLNYCKRPHSTKNFLECAKLVEMLLQSNGFTKVYSTTALKLTLMQYWQAYGYACSPVVLANGILLVFIRTIFKFNFNTLYFRLAGISSLVLFKRVIGKIFRLLKISH